MAVHPDGTGTGWTNVETVDVDQPHGKDYLYSQHIAKGVRKRINKEHSPFGDSTAGGEHIPGGCAVLDIVDGSADVTDGWNDGTYVGGGLVHETVKGRLWVCSTLDTTYDGAKDVTLVKLHPDLQWAGQDVTWAGAHEFDASVDITGNVGLDGDLTVDGKLAVDSSCDVSDVFIEGDVSIAGKLAIDGSCDFSDVYVDGDISVKGSLDVATDLSVSGDVAVDGTSNLTGAVRIGGDLTVNGKIAVDSSCDFSDVYVDGDMSVKGSLDVATDLSVSGDMAVDGTSNWTGNVGIAGALAVDSSCDLSDVFMVGDVSVAGKLAVDSSCDFSDVYVDGDISVKGSLDVATDLSVAGNIAVDGTAAKFGESLGIGLFYDPTAQAAAQSTTSANGSIHKMGTEVVAANTTDDVVYAVAFPTAFRSALCSFKSTQTNMNTPCQVFPKAAATKTTLQVTNSSGAQETIYWHAWGY